MKQLLLVFAAIAIMFASCTKQASDQLASEPVMKNYSELSEMIGEETAFKIFDDRGFTEYDPVLRGKRVKAGAAVAVWLNDLTISVSGGIVTSTVSPNAKWAGVQHWENTTTTDGAYGIWGCERYYSTPPGSGTETTCPYSPGGFLRGWSYDHVTGDVHVSIFLSVP